MWIFTQFFKKVHSTKPAASRSESAEIFVVCLGYKAPDKIDPRFLDPKHVFSEVEENEEQKEAASNQELVNPEKKKKKPAAEGYETGATVLFKSIKASEFIMGDKAIHILNNCNEIVLDQPRIRSHEKTTREIVECCKDIKVLGMKELRLLKKWRETLNKEFSENGDNEKQVEKNTGEASKSGKADSDEDDDNEMEELDAKVAEIKDEERRTAKRLKKRAAKEKRKKAEKIDLKMIIPGDKGPVREEEGLFKMSDLKSMEDVDTVTDKDPETLAESGSESDDEETLKAKTVPYTKEKGKIDKSGLFYKESDSEEEEEESEEEDEEAGGLGLVTGNGDNGAAYASDEEDEEEQTNPLLTDLDDSSIETKKQRKADLWFSREAFKNIEEDDDLAEEDIAETIKAYKKKNVKILSEERSSKSDRPSSDESGDDDDVSEEGGEEGRDKEFDVEESYRSLKRNVPSDQKDGFEVVPKDNKDKKGKKRGKVAPLTPEELALGQEMIVSKKRKRDILDAGWNRYMFNDRDEDLPDWFVKEERMHMRPRVESFDPKVAEEYRQRQKNLNVKTIKKVVEAKARKKRKLAKRMEKAKKKAAALMENPDVGSREKAREIQRMYKNASATQKKEVSYVVAKKHTAGKRARRPPGVKGVYKQVDPRMKKDTQKKRGNATSKRMQKRRLKGKKARTTRA